MRLHRNETDTGFSLAGIVLALFAAPAALAQAPGSESADTGSSERNELEEIIVSATRSTRSNKAIPNKVTLIDSAEIELQQSVALNPADLLSNLLPAFSPPRQKLDGQGESFRGRAPLFLIDGVPQSNPLRDGSRDGYTIDMSVVEQIEVIHGANAIQGLGATGGIINFITVRPPRSGELEQRAELGTTFDDDLEGDGFGYRGHYRAGKSFGRWDGVAAATFEKRGLYFDGEDRPVGVDPTQGEVADSESWNLFLKVGFDPTENQRFQLMVNDFTLQSDGDFIDVPGDRSIKLPTISMPGREPGEMAENNVTTITLNYANTALFGGRFSGQLFFQDFAGTYGGGTFTIFQDPLIAPVGTHFDQSRNISEKTGLRLTQGYDRVFESSVDLLFGIDFLEDETRQTLIATGRDWVPVTTYENVAPFFQLDFDATDWLTVVGGARFESAELDVPSYVTLAGNRASSDFMSVSVDGGKPDFEETLVNFGIVVRPTDLVSVYGTYSEGFGMPDVGRVLRGVSVPGTDVDSFVDLAPLVAENVEFGVEYEPEWGSIKVAWYESSSDFGAQLVPDADGIFSVNREKTVVTGWEISFGAQPLEWLDFAVSYSDLTGEFDSDDDGSVDSDLNAVSVGPDRLNVYVNFTPAGRWSGRVQSFTYFDKTFRNAAGVATAEFDGYTVVDALVAAEIGRVRLSLGIANILDETYLTYYSQAGTAAADRYFAGRGRTLNLTADFGF